MGIQTRVFCTSDPNLVILAWMGDELLLVVYTQIDTHTQVQATAIPEGQNWPRVKKQNVLEPKNAAVSTLNPLHYFFTHNSKCWKYGIHSVQIVKTWLQYNFTYHDRFSVMTCIQCFRELIAINGVIAKSHFHQVSIFLVEILLLVTW